MKPDPKDAKLTPKETIVHVYDGIEEADNELPRWWLGVLYGSIVFSVFYYFHFHVFVGGKSPMAEYDESMAATRAAQAASLKAMGTLDDAAFATLAKDAVTLEQGRTVFAQTCAPCHGPEGGGTIGPNLTDGFWIHGSAPTQILATVRDGIAAKGMPAWGAQLGADAVTAVTAYVVSRKGTNVPGGKAPQGDPEAM